MSDPRERQRVVDELLVRSIARWAALLSLLILAYDWAILGGYPFPGSSETLRGVVYVVVTVALLAATVFVTFLGYRIVSMRVAPGLKAIYIVFLPGAITLGSLVAFLSLAAPR